MVSVQNPSEEIRKQVGEMLFKATGIDPLQIDKLLEKPPEGIGADFAFPCFVLAKKEGRHPAQIAKEVMAKLKEGGMIKEIKVRDAYINFYANWEELAQKVVQMVLTSKEKYGTGEKKPEKVLVEHTSANPDGPLHLGHFRNTVLGDSLARIYKFYGYPVKTDFYFNTTGRQIGIAAMEYKSLNGKLQECKGPFSKKPDWEVLEFYKRGNRALETDKSLEKDIQDIMQKFESGDEELRKLYSEIVEKTLEGHKQTLGNMGVKVDNFKDEAKYLFGGEVHGILNEISKRVDIGKIDGKRIWVDLKRFGIDREFTLTRSDGTTLYPARDLAYHADKFSRADININVIGTDQKFYFQQLTSTLSMLYPDKAKHYTVVFYEFLLLPEGTMSTRLGRFVSVDELVEKAVTLAMETVEKKMPDYSKKDKESIANAVGIGALKYAMIKVSPEKTYSFSVEDALSFEGDNAPYIQYTYARAESILRKAGTKTIKPGPCKEDKELTLVKTMMALQGVVADAVRDFRPHYIANYVYRLATQFNDFYQSIPVLSGPEELVESRLALVKATATVINICLGLLGIDVPEKM